MGIWETIAANTSIDNLLSTLGLGALAVLFATDRILTKGQHDRRIADLTSFHERERDLLRTSREEEKQRADLATERLTEALEVGRAGIQMLHAVDQAAGGKS